MWTKDSLKQLVESKLKDYLFVVASNREPYIHKYGAGGINCIKPAAGLTAALDPVLQACGGTWIAHGSGDADKKVVDEKNKIKVPPENPKYVLKRVWLNKAEENGYYYGFANQALWPLCHIVYTKPRFDENDWNHYKSVNEKFAQTILEEIDNKDAIVFLQDYHLALVPKIIKEKNPKAKIALFWHIPWPNPEAFRICPWRKEIIEGLLGADLLGFHIRYHVDNFLETVNQTLEAKVDKIHPSIVYGGREVLVKPYPISVDFEQLDSLAKKQEIDQIAKRLKKELDLEEYEFLGVGIDRIDYTKGIPEKFIAIDRFLEKNPQYQGRFVFLEVGALSRIHIDNYKEINDEINSLVEQINWKYSYDHWVPIIMIRRNYTFEEIVALNKLANVCIVSSLHDGMNLVAKEFVVTNSTGKGMLLLSKFTGSAYELTDSLLINPFEPDSFAENLKQALEMPENEKTERMKKMKEWVRENNIYRWAADIVQSLLRL